MSLRCVLLQVLRGMPEFGDGTVDEALDGFSVPPSDDPLKEGIYFFLPGDSSRGVRVPKAMNGGGPDGAC